jgi:hypothetical protein
VTRLPRLIHVLEAQQYEAVIARVVTTTLEKCADRFYAKVVESCPIRLLEDIRGQAEHGPRRGQCTQVACQHVSQWPPRVTHSDADGNTFGPQDEISCPRIEMSRDPWESPLVEELADRSED